MSQLRQKRLSTLEVVSKAQNKFTFEDEDPGDPEADLDDSFDNLDPEAADSEDPDEFTKLGNDVEKSEIENFNFTIKTNFKLPQGDPGKAKFQSNSADCFTTLEVGNVIGLSDSNSLQGQAQFTHFITHRSPTGSVSATSAKSRARQSPILLLYAF